MSSFTYVDVVGYEGHWEVPLTAMHADRSMIYEGYPISAIVDTGSSLLHGPTS